MNEETGNVDKDLSLYELTGGGSPRAVDPAFGGGTNAELNTSSGEIEQTPDGSSSTPGD